MAYWSANAVDGEFGRGGLTGVRPGTALFMRNGAHYRVSLNFFIATLTIDLIGGWATILGLPPATGNAPYTHF